MKLTRRMAGLFSGLVATFALTLAGASPASAATWTLEHTPGHPQRICLDPGEGWPNTYFLVPLHGTWSTTITAGISDLPPGSYSDGGKIYPSDVDEDDWQYIGFVHVSIAPAPVGDHVATLWASDGTETQTVPVMISFGQDCYPYD
ncbi:DUF5980 family protein [Streptomyces sp. MP131-18]|uniref:DUF5980 family protein n=1 Tax=Streptomyces sp. MP131-18 TaxID=1857892 RepID=UPI00097C68D6|nr:DUF5980 family protein [Streptomyces sp. MP131-18]ONK09610.1 hypothetical protein STBA_03110 [Streptomyces sp. MP131-18]